jgi:lycopene cyclase domain-containing protein
VLATIAYVPVEEYLFFILQPILTGLFYFQYVARWTPTPQRARSSSAWIGFLSFLFVTAIGAALLISEWQQGFYMGLILSWAAPILAGMWLYDGQSLWAHRTTLLITVAVPTLYLWIADATAIGTGIWSISTTYTIGFSPFGLPIEEATFFLMTNLLVIHGLLLLLYGSHETVAVPSS